MKIKFTLLALSVLLIIAVTPGITRGQTEDLTSMYALIQSLTKQVETLRAQVESTKAQDVTSETVTIRTGLAKGVYGEDVKIVQGLLATDSTIYPTGLVTGYYGLLTTEAVRKFQERFGLPVSGDIDSGTHQLIVRYIGMQRSGQLSDGLKGLGGQEDEQIMIEEGGVVFTPREPKRTSPKNPDSIGDTATTTMCQMDAKICPDGSTVYRSGPKCEFLACPVQLVPTPNACQMDAKICPDGSTVYRSGPTCEFAACPVPPVLEPPVACPMLAVTCPDGTVHVASGPKCLVPACPLEVE